MIAIYIIGLILDSDNKANINFTKNLKNQNYIKYIDVLY